MLTGFFLTSCGNKTNEKSSDIETLENKTEVTNTNKVTDVIYSPNKDCKSFVESLDLSSLCFTEEKIPEYEVEGSKNTRCQFEITPNDNSNDIHMSITYSDYENSIYSQDGDTEMAKMMFEKTFDKLKSSQLYTKSTDVNDLGDAAYIGYNEGNNQKALAVRVSNVSFTIQLGRTDEKKSCILSDAELIKFGRLVLAGIKK